MGKVASKLVEPEFKVKATVGALYPFTGLLSFCRWVNGGKQILENKLLVIILFSKDQWFFIEDWQRADEVQQHL